MTLDNKFLEDARQGGVVILAGSDSDKPHIDKLVAELVKWLIPYEVRICSAHKQPKELYEMIMGYNASGRPLVYIAVAGGSDAVSGMSSYPSFGPVVSCPPDGVNMSCITNPPGSSNSFILNPANAARHCAQIFTFVAPDKYCPLLEKSVADKNAKLVAMDGKLRQDYAAAQAAAK